MQFTTSTSKLAAALLDPVRGVIERGLAGSALALGGPLGPRFGEDEGEEQGEGESPALRAVRPDREFWPAAGRIPPSAGDGVIASTRRDDGAASGDGIRQPAGATDPSLAGYASAGRGDTPFVAMRASADIWHPYAGAKLDRISATADSSEVLHPYTGAMLASDSSHVYRAHTGAASAGAPVTADSSHVYRAHTGAALAGTPVTADSSHVPHTHTDAALAGLPVTEDSSHVHRPHTDDIRVMGPGPVVSGPHEPLAAVSARVGPAPAAAVSVVARDMAPSTELPYAPPGTSGPAPDPSILPPEIQAALPGPATHSSPSPGVPVRPLRAPVRPEPHQVTSPRREETQMAGQLSQALRPALDHAATITDAALRAPEEPRVANHFAVHVQLGAKPGAVDPDAVEAALLDMLREAARRHGLEV
jgi:hypothetical protein